MNTNNNAIVVEKLEKAYKDKVVLKNVSFEVSKGSIFCMLGSNGSGKTTTVKILSTIISKDNGTVWINGYNLDTDDDKVRKSIRLTGQFSAVDDVLTAKENLQMVARLSHIKHYNERCIQLLKDFHLLDVADQRVATFSGGMRRRLDIAMSLIEKPAVLFLDEPTTGLDPQSRNAMWEIVQKLKDEGVTIFLTTQYLEEAEQLADVVAILHDGKIIEMGSVADIKNLSPYEYLSFTFANDKDLERTKELYENQIFAYDKEEKKITFEIKQGMDQITSIFLDMKNHGIALTSFTQHKETLEDVFLHLVEKKEDKGNA